MLPHAPGVQMQAIPEDAINDDSEDEDKSNPDERISIRASDKRIAPENEYSDSEDEGDSRRDKRYMLCFLHLCLIRHKLTCCYFSSQILQRKS